MSNVELFLFGSALLLILCVVASKATGKLGIPTLVVFLGVGILAGSEGIGGIYFDNAQYAQTLGIIALAYILFSGGLDTKVKAVRPVVRSALSLSTIGVLITCLSVGLFSHYFLDFSMLEGLLLGAIISSTDAGAVFTVLRSKNLNMKGSLKPLLELESGTNDPMAVFLTTMMLSLMTKEGVTWYSFIPLFIQDMLLGAGIGYFAGKGFAWGFNKLKLEFEGLYTVLSLAVVLIIYTTAQGFHGNGFLAVYVAGVVLGNETFVFKKTLILLHDGVSWLMQSCMFVTLGLLIFPSAVMKIAFPGILLSTFIILFARPLSVFLSLSASSLNWREKLLLSWVGLRGSVPIVMATYPLVAGIDQAETLFNLVFFVALSSLMVQGTTIDFVAKLLRVDAPALKKPDFQVEYTSTANTKNNMVYVEIPEGSVANKKTIVEMKFPVDLLIVLIERRGEVIIPRGATELETRDKILVLSEKESLRELKDKVNQLEEILPKV